MSRGLECTSAQYMRSVVRACVRFKQYTGRALYKPNIKLKTRFAVETRTQIFDVRAFYWTIWARVFIKDSRVTRPQYEAVPSKV